MLSIDISSYASPEGEVDLNTNLAEDRGKSAMSFLMSRAKRMKFEPAKKNHSLMYLQREKIVDLKKRLQNIT